MRNELHFFFLFSFDSFYICLDISHTMGMNHHITPRLTENIYNLLNDVLNINEKNNNETIDHHSTKTKKKNRAKSLKLNKKKLWIKTISNRFEMLSLNR